MPTFSSRSCFTSQNHSSLPVTFYLLGSLWGDSTDQDVGEIAGRFRSSNEKYCISDHPTTTFILVRKTSTRQTAIVEIECAMKEGAELMNWEGARCLISHNFVLSQRVPERLLWGIYMQPFLSTHHRIEMYDPEWTLDPIAVLWMAVISSEWMLVVKICCEVDAQRPILTNCKSLTLFFTLWTALIVPALLNCAACRSADGVKYNFCFHR